MTKTIDSPNESGEYVIEEDLQDVKLNDEWTTVSCFAVYFHKHEIEELEFQNAFPTLSAAEEYIKSEIMKSGV